MGKAPGIPPRSASSPQLLAEFDGVPTGIQGVAVLVSASDAAGAGDSTFRLK